SRSPAPVRPVRSTPSIETVPAVGDSSPVRQRMRVDLPAPERPTMPYLPGRDRQVDLLQGDGVCEHLSQAAQFDHRRLLVWLVSADDGGGRRGYGDGRTTVQ